MASPSRVWMRLLVCFFLTASTYADDDSLELIFSDNVHQLVGVAVSANGRVFSNYPLWSDNYKYAVVEIINATAIPYPNPEMNSWKPGQNGADKWVCVQAVFVDDEDSLWVVDPASPRFSGVYQDSHKLVKVNLTTNTIQRVYNFTGVVDNQGYINDVRVDTQTQTAYLTNSNTGGIIVVDLVSGVARQLLQNHYSVRSDINFNITLDGKPMLSHGSPFVVHADGLALTPDGQWLYYKPLSDDKLYRIQTQYLRDPALTAGLASKVQDLGHQTVSDGMICDTNGNLYLGDLTSDTVFKLSPQMQLTPFIRDPRLVWPDSFAVSQDGFLYVSTAHIHRSPAFNAGIDKRTRPYSIYRKKLHL